MKETKTLREIRKIVENVETQDGVAKRYNNDAAILINMTKPGDGEGRYLLELISTRRNLGHDGVLDRTMSFIQATPQGLCAIWAVLDELVRTDEFNKELLKSLMAEIKTIPIKKLDAEASGDADGDIGKAQEEGKACQ